MHRITYVFLTCCLAFLSPAIAHAVTLQYTGNAFTITGAGAGNITATVDFLTPLTNGATLGPADITSFTITGPDGTMTTAGATFTAHRVHHRSFADANVVDYGRRATVDGRGRYNRKLWMS